MAADTVGVDKSKVMGERMVIPLSELSPSAPQNKTRSSTDEDAPGRQTSPESRTGGVVIAELKAAEVRHRDAEAHLAQEFPDGARVKGRLLKFVNGSIERLTEF